jgi:hypothetical protein
MTLPPLPALVRRLALGCLGALLLPAAWAQYELQSGTFNQLYYPGATAPAAAGASATNFGAVQSLSSASGAIAATGTLASNFPAQTYAGGKAILLRTSRLGYSFPMGVPRFQFGDQVPLPTTNWASAPLAAGSTYWRVQPLQAGEEISQPDGSVPGTPKKLVAIAVSAGGSGYSTAPTVTITGGGGAGATATAVIAGGAVTAVNLTSPGFGYTSVPTLSFSAGAAQAAVVAEEYAPAGVAASVYYSPHAQRTYAAQAGRAAVTWVTSLPQSVTVNGVAVSRYLCRQETFSVSSATALPIRQMYWTEKTFTAPPVSVPASSVLGVIPIFSTNFPAQASAEYVVPGVSTGSDNGSISVSGPITLTMPNPSAEMRTLWLSKIGTVPQLRAYNLEGRILIEYLGAPVTGGAGQQEFLGMDVLDVLKYLPPTNAVVNVGDRIDAVDAAGARLPADLNLSWTATPVTESTPGAVSYFGSAVAANGTSIYYAERENDNPDRVTFYWQNAIPVGRPPIDPTIPTPLITWPVLKNAYAVVWPSSLASYQHNIVQTGGSTPTTGISFGATSLPTIVYQDFPSQDQARIDLGTQRLVVSPDSDGLNRTLIKFTSGTALWYVRLQTQVAGRTGFQEPDGGPALSGTVSVGSRLVAPSGYAAAGRLESGTNYWPAAYQDPSVVGHEVAATGAIIPVNALPGKSSLTVSWFREVPAPAPGFTSFYVPGKRGSYTVSYPGTADSIVLASNAGSGDLSPSEVAGSLYVQNDRTLPGFNPNEEHALLLNGRAYALRDDLNVLGSNPDTYTSAPFVLVAYLSAVDGRPAMHPFQVLRETGTILFSYPIVAGTPVQAPMPIPLLPLALDAAGVVKNTEGAVTGETNVVATAASAPVKTAYAKFTFTDRKGANWVFRGPHNPAASPAPTFTMNFWYPMRDGFFFPGLTTQPTAGTALPYLRPKSGSTFTGDAVLGAPLPITYVPKWPDYAPSLRVGETLTLAKFGLPNVYNQTSAAVVYDQGLAGWSTSGATSVSKAAVVLHDPVRKKAYALSPAGLPNLPSSILTTASGGKSYFQGLPPHLQSRLYYDPMLGSAGSLVFNGELVDEVLGEDYLNLNVLSPEDLITARGLVATSDTLSGAWTTAINNLFTVVQTFVPDPLKAGTYKVDSSLDQTLKVSDSAVITSGETAVSRYALASTGLASGWVAMVFGNGKAFTPAAEPVQMSIFRVAPQLYPGEVKVITASNPLSEQVTLRHTADFAARPDLYDFEWRYSPPLNGLPPAIYTYAMTSRLAQNWKELRSPVSANPNPTDYPAASVLLPRDLPINSTGGKSAAGFPGATLLSAAGVNFSAGIPDSIVFSATVDALTGFILYINNQAVVVYRVPGMADVGTPTTGLVETGTGGLPLQFGLESSNFDSIAANKVELALFSTADLNKAQRVDFRIHAANVTDQVTALGSPWTLPNGTLTNIVTIGGSATTPPSPLASPLLVLTDNYFTMRYRPKSSTNVAGNTKWSLWTQPKLVEGWVKRVLAGINPFSQRMTDFGSNTVNTEVSVLTQAGKRWEGDVALNLNNINSFGLIEIYETLLRRAKSISVDAGYDYAGANDALLLAAGYLNDLYGVLGNEAYADAANPTVAAGTSPALAAINTSRFSFEGQVSGVLGEELSLLRGRDDFLAPGVQVSPVYNRLIWNFTRGINSGEAIYSVNYNIREAGSGTATNGVVDAADAALMFPQGHGDAYGHYLTAVKVYYSLLTNPKFTWAPRAETVSILGQPVSVDYFDERKFADSAAALTRTAQQVLALTWRQAYSDDPSAGWSSLGDGKNNVTTGVTRQWGVDEWASRAGQGSYFHWVVANALLPERDLDPTHVGIAAVDRTSVPALVEIAAAGASIQTTLNGANAHLNPLGLSPGAVAFDISPTELKAGKSHYEQIYERALQAANNAKAAYDQAASMSAQLRGQDETVAALAEAISDQESAFVKKLVDIYGKPYSGDVGVGKLYAESYVGPDLYDWFIIDRPASNVFDATKEVAVTVTVPVEFKQFTALAPYDVSGAYNTLASTASAQRTVTVAPNRFVQFADTYAAQLGSRPTTGLLQQALLEAQIAQLRLTQAAEKFRSNEENFKRKRDLFAEFMFNSDTQGGLTDDAEAKMKAKRYLAANLRIASDVIGQIADTALTIANGAREFLPEVVGFSNDITAPVRGSIVLAGSIIYGALKVTAIGTGAGSITAAADLEQMQADLNVALAATQTDYDVKQIAYEYELMFRELMSLRFEIGEAALKAQQAGEQVTKLIDEGNRVQAEREGFRKRAAARIQGYRTRDLTFRSFRSEALEQYRTLYDLAARYTFLAAKSYDYDTGLLGSTAGQSVLNAIVAARALGDLTGGVPRVTTGATGDAGLAGAMAKLQSDWSVAKFRLGINNPDQNGTLFSLRRELFRIRDDPSITSDDTQWSQTLQQNTVPNLMADPDVANYCRNLQKPDGSAVPGIIIPFRTAVQHGQNFFGLPLADGDHSFSASNFSTKIYSVGVVLSGYVGMDPNLNGSTVPVVVFGSTPNALSATPYMYLIPTGTDYMRSPPLGDLEQIRGWSVADQALPLPFNLGATAFSASQYVTANGSLTEQPWVLRKHQAFRAVSDPSFFYSTVPAEFTSSRLVGRSAWNSGWKIVIPAYSLYSNEQEGLNRLAASLTDIKLFLRTYSNAGN